MTDQTQENMDRLQQERERDDVLERDQLHKGYGEDEGEREAALPDEGKQE